MGMNDEQIRHMFTSLESIQLLELAEDLEEVYGIEISEFGIPTLDARRED